MLLGHVAVPLLLNHYFDLEAAPLFAASVFPDVVDKSLHELGWAVNGRTAAHSLAFMGVTTLLVHTLLGKAAARAWFTGYLGHLLCDMGGFVPWFYPFRTYRFERSGRSFWQKVTRWSEQVQLAEIGLLIWAAAVMAVKLLRK